jgi:hypothetical protein
MDKIIGYGLVILAVTTLALVTVQEHLYVG